MHLKFNQNLLPIIFILFLATKNLNAQTVNEENINSDLSVKIKANDIVETNEKTLKNWQFSLDAINLIQRGFGAELNHSLAQNFSFGIYAKSFKLIPLDYSSARLSTKHEVTEAGIKLSYYSNGFSNDGWVISGNYGRINVKSTGKGNFTSLFLSEDVKWEESVKSTKPESQLFAGYQFLGRKIGDHSNVIVRTGLGYGTGGKLAVNYGGTKNQINNGMFFDVNFGLLF